MRGEAGRACSIPSLRAPRERHEAIPCGRELASARASHGPRNDSGGGWELDLSPSQLRQHGFGTADVEAARFLYAEIRHLAVVGDQRVTLAADPHAARHQVE